MRSIRVREGGPLKKDDVRTTESSALFGRERQEVVTWFPVSALRLLLTTFGVKRCLKVGLRVS